MWDELLRLIIKSWQSRNRVLRLAIIFVGLATVAVAGLQLLNQTGFLNHSFSDGISKIIAGLAGLVTLVVVGYQRVVEEQVRTDRVEHAEEEFRRNPEKPQLAWDLARTKLESYLDRNLSQVRSIYWLTLLVMAFGFGVVVYGLLEAFGDPRKLNVSIVASASGVFVSFIGGSFLVVYRSILAQSKDYVSVLERINAVGMAVQVIANIPERSAKRKDQAMVTIANDLLGMYASHAQSPGAASRGKRRNSAA
jgi:hypothetical protein